jgi:hypothetical protein
LTISRLRLGLKRQSVVKLTSRNLQVARCQCLAQVATKGAGRVEVVQRTGNQQIGVGIKVLGKLVTLVTQVAFDLELHVLRLYL